MSLISFDPEKCTACGICSQICPVNIILPGEDGIPSLPAEYEAFCSRCGHCEASCPHDAIRGNYPAFAPADNAADTTKINSEVLTKYVQSRRSIRVFKDMPVEKEKIARILEAVRFAPSGVNAQPVKWLVITDAAEVKKLSALTIEWMRRMAESDAEHPFMPIFPALVALSDAGLDPICRNAPGLVYAYGENATGYTDSIIALTTFDLVAPSFGLGTCWAGLLHIAAQEYQPLKEALGLPEGQVLQYPMLVGYPKYKLRKIPGRKQADVIWK
ncbi:nitroreductase [Methanosarcina sp. KYL-1]|uniref:nitroreductase family protein n=1 Tax=Methanosarcina sp. KYL-1 TaxID=2602068 RepID=UPI0021009DA1|nr:nitroreductase family protein [Methanosarcina sp. KYL-1]MCQ1535742.1 nitroreductase [Methanosarcina sp. KYL-1]